MLIRPSLSSRQWFHSSRRALLVPPLTGLNRPSGVGWGQPVSVRHLSSKSFTKSLLSSPAVVATMARAAWRDPSVISHWAEDLQASVRHGWKWVKNGFRLFYKNISISKRLVWKSLMGHQLSLRESKLLVTTTTDLFKLVPFSFFIIIPFAELALPLFLRLFPNMLPSTFMERNFADSASVSRRIRAKRELADFFQHVIEERNRQLVEEAVEEAAAADMTGVGKSMQIKQFKELLLSETAAGVKPFPSVPEIARFAKLFEDEFKLENMPLEHLQQICRMLGLEPFGFKSHVVLQLRHTVNRLQAEDRRILWEGVESLTKQELEDACQARGMPVTTTEPTMQRQLEHWLQLSSSKDVPVSLLLWSRTCFRPDSAVEAEEPPAPPTSEEELFEETAERLEDRAEDVERRLEKLEQLENEEEELGPREAGPHTAHVRVEAELELAHTLAGKHEKILADQIASLAKLQSIPWLLPDARTVWPPPEQVREVRNELSATLEKFQKGLAEVELLQKRGAGGEDHRFYPDE